MTVHGLVGPAGLIEHMFKLPWSHLLCHYLEVESKQDLLLNRALIEICLPACGVSSDVDYAASIIGKLSMNR